MTIKFYCLYIDQSSKLSKNGFIIVYLLKFAYFLLIKFLASFMSNIYKRIAKVQFSIDIEINSGRIYIRF